MAFFIGIFSPLMLIGSEFAVDNLLLLLRELLRRNQDCILLLHFLKQVRWNRGAGMASRKKSRVYLVEHFLCINCERRVMKSEQSMPAAFVTKGFGKPVDEPILSK